MYTRPLACNMAHTTATQHREDMVYYRSIYEKMSKKELVELIAWTEALRLATERNRLGEE